MSWENVRLPGEDVEVGGNSSRINGILYWHSRKGGELCAKSSRKDVRWKLRARLLDFKAFKQQFVIPVCISGHSWKTGTMSATLGRAIIRAGKRDNVYRFAFCRFWFVCMMCAREFIRFLGISRYWSLIDQQRKHNDHQSINLLIELYRAILAKWEFLMAFRRKCVIIIICRSIIIWVNEKGFKLPTKDDKDGLLALIN